METIVISAFCGTGKTYTDNNSDKKTIEFECWEYDKGDFPNNYIDDIKFQIGKMDYIFISTNPVVLKELHKQGVNIKLIYPDISLKEEYFKRYLDRGSSSDFMDTLDRYWFDWLIELKEQNYCQHILLESGQYISNVLK